MAIQLNKRQLRMINRLTKAQVDQVCLSYKKKVNPQALAKTYNLDSQSLLHIVATQSSEPELKKKLSSSQIAQLRLSYIDGMKITELAIIYDRVPSAIHYYVYDLAEERRDKKQKELIEPIRHDYLRGKTLKDLASQYKQTKSMIYYHVRDLSSHPERVRSCGLTNQRIKDLRQLHAQSQLSIPRLAKQFQIPEEAVRGLVYKP